MRGESRPDKPVAGRFAAAQGAGFSVIPLGARSKVPEGEWARYRDAPATADDAARWDRTDKNVGIITGQPSGVFVLDLDGPDGIAEAHRRGWVVHTAKVQTGKGEHHFYKLPDFRIGNKAGVAPNVDIRGDGGQVVGAGSVHPNGNLYAWAIPADQIADAPAALLDVLRPQRRPRSANRRPVNGGGEFDQIINELLNAGQGTRNDLFNRAAFRAGQMSAAGLLDAVNAEERLADAARDAGLDEREIDHILPRVIDEGMASPRNSDGEEPISQVVMANIWAERRARDRRHDHTAGKWMHVDPTSGVWRADDCRATFNEIGTVIHEFGAGAPRYSNAGFIGGTETIARGLPAVAVTHEHFDTDKMMLGTPAGPVDLRTGKTLRPNPSLLISKSASVAPAAGEPTKWLTFLMQSTGQDALMVEFLQRVVGYMLTGLTVEQALFFIYGDGGNGKGVFINVIRRIMGEYAVTAAMETFTASRNEQHPTGLAMLRGSRLATASETEQGRPWAESRLKQLTGSDEISARFMRQDFFSYVPEFKLLIIGNFHPVLNTVDDAMKRRFNIIPFTRKPEFPNPHLEQELEAEFPQILSWMIEGCLKWQSDGLRRPFAVIDATADYFDDQDVFGQWLEEFCEIAPGHAAGSQELFHNWTLFADEMGEQAGTMKGFGSLMSKRGFRSARATAGNRARFWKGLKLQTVLDPRTGVDVTKTPVNAPQQVM